MFPALSSFSWFIDSLLVLESGLDLAEEEKKKQVGERADGVRTSAEQASGPEFNA